MELSSLQLVVRDYPTKAGGPIVRWLTLAAYVRIVSALSI